MMLTAMENFDTTTRLTAVIKGWCAICRETGAFLSASRGRSKNGNAPRYVLILPNKPLSERGLFGDYEWDTPDRKFIRAWTDEEAISTANIKLVKMMSERAKRIDDESV